MSAQRRQAPPLTTVIADSSSDEDAPDHPRQQDQPLSTRLEQREHLRQLQAKLNELEGENERLKLTIAQGKRQHDTSGPDSKVLLMQFAKKFCFTAQLWLQSSPHRLARLKAPEHFDRYSRYITTRTNDNATPRDQAEKEAIAELWEILQVLPGPLEGLDLNKPFFERMGDEMSDFRSHLQNRVRSHRTLLLSGIGDLTAEDLLSMDDAVWRFQSPKVRELAGFSVDSDGLTTYAFMPPILLDNNEYEVTKKRMFRNTIIERILVLCLMGPASLKKPPPYKPTAKVNCNVWGVKAVNGNMVAAAAVLARFLLSSDAEFTKEKRLVHAVNWKKTFFEYKSLLWNDRKPSVRSLLQDLNDKIFGEESPATRPRRSFSPATAPNLEFVSLATALDDEESEPVIDAQVPRALQPRDPTIRPLDPDDGEDDDFDVDLDATRSASPIPPIAPTPNGLSLLADASLTVRNEIPASETGSNLPVSIRPVNSRPTTIANPSTVNNSSRAARVTVHFEGEYVESSETDDDRPKKPRNAGRHSKKQKQKSKTVAKENTAPQPTVGEGAVPKRKRGRPKSMPANADAI